LGDYVQSESGKELHICKITHCPNYGGYIGIDLTAMFGHKYWEIIKEM